MPDEPVVQTIPEPDPIEFPKFPTLFTEQDRARLTELNKQKSALSEAYNQKFSADAWQASSAVERGIRRVSLPFMSNVADFFSTEGTQPGLEFALTPEQFNTKSSEFIQEFTELARKEKVTRLLPEIQTDILMLAFQGKPISSIEELTTLFPVLNNDFTDQEIGYLSRVTEAILNSSPEDILSGKVFSHSPLQLPASEADLQAMLLEGTHNPNDVFASIGFSKSVEDVSAALRAVFESQEPETPVADSLRGKINEFFQLRAEELGIVPEQETKAAILRRHEQIAIIEGKNISLVDDTTGGMIAAKLRDDGTVYIDDILVGYQLASGQVFGFNLQGQPVLSIEHEQIWFKDLWDAIYVGTREAFNNIGRAFTETIPNAILTISQKAAPYTIIGDEKAKEAAIAEIESWKRSLRIAGDEIKVQHDEWLEKNPQFKPRQEYLVSVTENPELLKDPFWYAYTIFSNAPIMVAALAVGTATTIATGGNVWAGALAGAAVMTPVEIQGVKDDLVASGADPDSADILAVIGGGIIGAIEVLPGVMQLRAISPAFMRLFRKELTKEITTKLAVDLTKRQIVGQSTVKGLQIWATETIEEGLQEMVQNAVVRTVDESRGIFDNVPDALIQAAVAVFPLAVVGGGASYSNMKKRLPSTLREEIDTTKKLLEDAGLEEPHAEQAAFSIVIDDDTAQNAVLEAYQEAQDAGEIVEQETPTDDPVIISDEMEVELKDKGFDQAQINEMEPAEAGEILTAEPVVEPIEELARLKNELSGLNLVEITELTAKEKRELTTRSKKLVADIAKLEVPVTEQVSVIPSEPTPTTSDSITLEAIDKARVVKDSFPNSEGTVLSIAVESLEIDLADAIRTNQPKVATRIRKAIKALKVKPKPVNATVTPQPPQNNSSTQLEAMEKRMAGYITDLANAHDILAKEQAVVPDDTPSAIQRHDSQVERATTSVQEIENEISALTTKMKKATKALNPVQPKKAKSRKPLPPAEPIPASADVTVELSKIQVTYVNKLAMAQEIPGVDIVEGILAPVPRTLYTAIYNDKATKVRSGTLKTLDGDINDRLPGLVDTWVEEAEKVRAEAVAEAAPVEVEEPTTIVPPKVKVQKQGLCYRDAWRYQVAHPDTILVHGTVHNADGTAIKHAWVEIPIEGGVEIFEPQTGQIMTQEHFALSRPIEDHRYTAEEAAIMALRNKAHGAWESPEFQAVNDKIKDGAEIEIVSQSTASEIEAVVEETPDIFPNDQGDFPTGYGEQFDPEEAMLRSRRARTLDWDDEQAGVESALENPQIAEAIIIPKKIRDAREKTATTIDKLQDGYLEARESGDKDRIKKIEDVVKKLAKDIRIPPKDLLGKRWDNLPPILRAKLVLALLPDASIKFSGAKEIFDMEYFMEFLEELTGSPFYDILRRVESADAEATAQKDIVMYDIHNDPLYKNIMEDEVALERVAQEINYRNQMENNPKPEGLTIAEEMLADRVQEIYKAYEPIVRYLRVMRTESTKEAFESEFPDAVKAGLSNELEAAMQWKQMGNLDVLWNYLYDKNWGVINTGFDPRFIASPELSIKRNTSLNTTRGKGHLLRRNSIEYPGSGFNSNLLIRLSTYIEQMEIQWRLEPELDTLAEYWSIASLKFEDWSTIKKGFDNWIERLQHIGLGFGWWEKLAIRGWRQSMTAIFLEPLKAMRNSAQAFLFHPDRTELVKYLVKRRSMSLELREKGRVYFDVHVSQLGGLKQDYLMVGEPGIKGLGRLNKFADKISPYKWSDYFPRMLSFNASMMKASNATARYLVDRNVQKWIKRSGARHLRPTERNYVLTHFLGQPDTNFDAGIKGLREVSGADMATFYVAQRMADITHFKYRRATRGIIEQGKMGTTMFNLLVFPRGYGQRLWFQSEKIKNAFAKETTWDEAREGVDDIFKLVAMSLVFDGLWRVISGRDRNPYWYADILFGWTFGGLFVGIVQDITSYTGDIATLANPLADEERKDLARNRLPKSTERLADALIPFYKRMWDMVDSAQMVEHRDRQLVKELLAKFDEKYTPEELDKLDLDWWERGRLFFWGAPPSDPTTFEKVQTKIHDVFLSMGTWDEKGNYITVANLASTIRTQTKDFPTMMISEREGFDPLVEFYMESEAQWKAILDMTNEEKTAWRKGHILEEAMLLFWEKERVSVFRRGTPEGEEVLRLVRFWFERYDITEKMHRAWADWTQPTP